MRLHGIAGTHAARQYLSSLTRYSLIHFAFKKLLQRDRIVMLSIMGAVHERHPASPGLCQERLPGIRMFLQFAKVTLSELAPFCRIVLKPFA